MSYKIKKERETYTVFQDGKVLSKGFNNKRDALQSIWVINGSNPAHFYECLNDNGDVSCLVDEAENDI